MATKKIITFDYGATSGRGILGEYDGSRITATELHRFSNDPVRVTGHLTWDVLRLFFELKAGLIKAAIAGHKDIESIGVDTWGVDFGLLNAYGQLIGNPFAYRDELTEGEMERVFGIVPKKEIYDRTGLQFLRFNTLFQLTAIKEKYPEILAGAKDLLLMPDLINYLLTGVKAAEFSIVSTTQMFNLQNRDWDYELLAKLGIDPSILQKIVPSGTMLGGLLPDIAEETGIENAKVCAVCGHDTGSAVLAIPMERGERCVYLSCGTWSLLGVELSAPRNDDAAFAIDYTNEGGFDNTTRFLKNIMGLWIYTEVKREFERREGEVDYDTLNAEVLAAPGQKCYIDPDDDRFMTPGRMVRKIREYCRETGQPEPETRGEVLRCVLESLALKYRYAIEQLEGVLGYYLPCMRALGGGCKNRILMQFTANAIRRPVYAGPVEATAFGNMAAQLITLGEAKDRWEARQIVARSTDIESYEPKDGETWGAMYEKFKEIITKGAQK